MRKFLITFAHSGFKDRPLKERVRSSEVFEGDTVFGALEKAKLQIAETHIEPACWDIEEIVETK